MDRENQNYLCIYVYSNALSPVEVWLTIVTIQDCGFQMHQNMVVKYNLLPKF